MPFSTYGANRWLNTELRLAAYTPAASNWVGLYTTMPDNGGASGVEATGGSYARVRVDNILAAAASKAIANSSQVTFPTLTASIGTARGFGIFDASTSGNLIFFDIFSTARRAFTALAATDVCQCAGHDFVATDRVRTFDPDDSALPGGLEQFVTYYVISPSGNTFQLSLTEGGAAINVSSDGSGLISRITEQPLNTGVTVQFPISNLTVNIF